MRGFKHGGHVTWEVGEVELGFEIVRERVVRPVLERVGGGEGGVWGRGVVVSAVRSRG